MARTASLIALLLLATPAIPLLGTRVDLALGEHRAQEALYVDGDRLKRLAPGFSNLLADIYWLRTVQYYGRQRAFEHVKRYDLLLPLVEITTTLDPRLEIAYRYGATFLAEPYPAGAGQPRIAIHLLEKGVRAMPRSWRLWQDLGLFHFFFLKDAEAAAEVFTRASRIPDAPYWMQTLAAQVLVRGGEREASRLLWQRIHDEADAGPLKENAAAHLRYIQALDSVDELNRAVEAYRLRNGRLPPSLEVLRREGWTRAPIVDPLGVPFAYDVTAGKVAIARNSPVWRNL